MKEKMSVKKMVAWLERLKGRRTAVKMVANSEQEMEEKKV